MFPKKKYVQRVDVFIQAETETWRQNYNFPRKICAGYGETIKYLLDVDIACKYQPNECNCSRLLSIIGIDTEAVTIHRCIWFRWRSLSHTSKCLLNRDVCFLTRKSLRAKRKYSRVSRFLHLYALHVLVLSSQFQCYDGAGAGDAFKYLCNTCGRSFCFGMWRLCRLYQHMV